MDRDLLEVTIPQLEELYRSHKYTVTEVVKWHMARIARDNGVYGAVQGKRLTPCSAGAAAVGGERSPPLLRTWRCWAMAPIRATRSGCLLPPALLSACFRRAAW